MKLPHLSPTETLLVLDHDASREALIVETISHLVWEEILVLKRNSSAPSEELWENFDLEKAPSFKRATLLPHQTYLVETGFGENEKTVPSLTFFANLWNLVSRTEFPQRIEEELAKKLQRHIEENRVDNPNNPFEKSYKGGWARLWLRIKQRLGFIPKGANPTLDDLRYQIGSELNNRISTFSSDFNIIVQTNPFEAWRSLHQIKAIMWLVSNLDDQLLLNLSKWTRKQGRSARKELAAVNVPIDFPPRFTKAKVDQTRVLRDLANNYFRLRQAQEAPNPNEKTWLDVAGDFMDAVSN